MGIRAFRFHWIQFRRTLFYSVSCYFCYYLILFFWGTTHPSAHMLLHATTHTDSDITEWNLWDVRNMLPKQGPSVNPTRHAGDAGAVSNITELPWCSLEPKDTDDTVKLKLNNMTFEELVAELGDRMQDGGHFRPRTCRSLEHLAIIIPYRDRKQNLLVLLHNLLPFLWHQMTEFTVFVVEQTAEFPFNKGVLFNAAFRELQKRGGFTCYIMQDVDLIPMDHRNLYRCGKNPRHLCLTTGQTEWSNKLMYPMAFGGAVALRPSHIDKANGFSNYYYGWGLEDDDLILRLTRKLFRIDRYPIAVGKYYRLDHDRMPYNPRWNELKKSMRTRQTREGLNTLNYTLVLCESTPIYSRLVIRVPPPPQSIYGTSDHTSPHPNL